MRYVGKTKDPQVSAQQSADAVQELQKRFAPIIDAAKKVGSRQRKRIADISDEAMKDSIRRRRSPFG